MSSKSFYSHETATVENEAKIGEGSKIWHYAHIRSGAVLGKNTIVGKSSYIDTNVIIGDNVKVQNLVSIYDGVQIGNNVFIGPHVAFTNDLRPRIAVGWKLIKTKVEDGVSIGANSTIICGITLGKFCFVGAGSVVTKDVPTRGLVYGNPAKLKGWVCKCGNKIFNSNLELGKESNNCNDCKNNS